MIPTYITVIFSGNLSQPVPDQQIGRPAKGMAKGTRDMILDLLFEKFSVVPAHVSNRIRKMAYLDGLKALFRQALKCPDMETFEAILERMSEADSPR